MASPSTRPTRPWWCRCDARACACPRWSPGALSHDFGGRDRYGGEMPWTSRATSETACHWPAKWRPIAVAILDLPVPVRDEPAAVSGEVGRP